MGLPLLAMASLRQPIRHACGIVSKRCRFRNKLDNQGSQYCEWLAGYR